MSRRNVVRVAASVALSGLVSLPVQAQAPRPERGYAIAYGGLSSTEVSSPTFGGSFGVNVMPDLLIIGELGRSQKVEAPFTKDDLALLDQGFAALGLPSASSVKMAVNYYSGGIKYLVPLGGAIRPYVSVNGGVAHMSPQPTFTVAGMDVTSEVLQEGLSTYFREETRPMASLSGGVAIAAGHVVFDAGYKYSAVFIKTDYLQAPESPHSHSRIDTHQFTAGVGIKF